MLMQVKSHLSVLIHDLANKYGEKLHLRSRSLAATSGSQCLGISFR